MKKLARITCTHKGPDHRAAPCHRSARGNQPILHAQRVFKRGTHEVGRLRPAEERTQPMPLFESQPWLLVPLIVITIEAWAALKARIARRNQRCSPRQKGPESTIYYLSATLIAYAIEEDGDYHLVLSDQAGNTMITEIPDPTTLDPQSRFSNPISLTRSTFTDRFQQQLITLASARNLLLHAAASLGASIQPPMINHVSTPISLSGIGFFDVLHGQTGVAPNGIEIHPVLSISFES